MTDDETRHECYPSLPLVDWASKAAQREARRAAVDERNDRMPAAAVVAVAAVKGGSIGGGKIKEAKKP
jgi:hypothetical protein